MSIHVMIIIGILILGFTYWRNKEVLRLDLQVLNKFFMFMVFFTFFRLFLFSLVYDLYGVDITSFNNGIGLISFWKIGLVFWEDAFFALPIYYMKDKWKWSKFIWVPIVTFMSIRFGIGHMYQFNLAFVPTLFVPYFIFYKYGMKHGFRTTMACHILFDAMTFLTFKLAAIVVL